MKSEMKIINAYIKNASNGIRDRKVKNEVKDELLSHLLEIYDRNIALGLSDEDAQKDAIAHMGDSEAISKTFKKIYPVSSAEYFKSSGWGLAYPILFLFMFYNAGHVDTIFIITFALFYSLLKIRKVNKYFNIAFITTILNAVIQIVFLILKCHLIFNNALSIGIYLSHCIMITIIYTIIILGIIKIKKQLNEPKADFYLAYASIPAIILIIVIAILLQNTISWFMLLQFAIGMLPASVIYTTVRDIDNLGLKIPHKMHTKKKIMLIFLVLFILTICFVVSSFFVAYPPVEYTTDDTQTDVNEIIDNLIELGLPENITYDLPESEILKYQSATELEIYEEDKPFNLFADDEDVVEDLTESHYIAYIFTLPETETEPLKFRILVAIDRFEDFDESLYTALSIDYYNKYESNDLFCKMLCDIDGVTKEIAPIFNEQLPDDVFEYLCYIFTPTNNAENHRTYISQTITPTPSNERISIEYEYKQDSLYDFNNPFEKGKYFWGTDRIYASVENPIYVPSEDVTNGINEYPTNQYIDDENIDFNTID